MSKNTKKILLTTFCALVLVAGSVMGTLAYLTSTDQVNNTFTVGKVKITLDEAAVKYDDFTNSYIVDTKADPARVKANTYKVLPGMEIAKDPTITVIKGSEKAYVGAVVKLTVKDIKNTPLWNGGYVGLAKFISGGIADCEWTADGLVFTSPDGKVTLTQSMNITDSAEEDDVITFTYVFKDVQDASSADVKLVLFEKLSTKVEADKWTNEALAAMGDFKIDVDAYAVQAAGFADANTALQTAFNASGATIF